MAEQIARREQIREVAGSLFSERGYHATTVRGIARELNLQGGSLYAHIASKEDVLWEIVERAAREFLERVAPIASERGSASERLTRMIAEHVRIVAGHTSDATVFFHEWRFLGGERRQRVIEQRDAYEAAFRKVISEGVRSGEFRPADPKLAALAVLSTVNWTYQWYRPGGELAPDEVAAGFADLLLRGLCKEDER